MLGPWMWVTPEGAKPHSAEEEEEGKFPREEAEAERGEEEEVVALAQLME